MKEHGHKVIPLGALIAGIYDAASHYSDYTRRILRTDMRNVTYRDLKGRERAALIVGHTPAGEHLVFFEPAGESGDEELHIRGPMKSSAKALPHEESWSSEGHVYGDKSSRTTLHPIELYDDDDDLYLDY